MAEQRIRVLKSGRNSIWIKADSLPLFEKYTKKFGKLTDAIDIIFHQYDKMVSSAEGGNEQN